MSLDDKFYARTNPVADVIEFNHAYGVIPEKAICNDPEAAPKAWGLILEECREYAVAENEVESADALGDTIYVCTGYMARTGGVPRRLFEDEMAMGIEEGNPARIMGAALALGWCNGWNMNEIFAEIHQNNMQKMCKTPEHAAATVASYAGGPWADCEARAVGEYYVCRHRPSGKVLKAAGWVPPRLGKN
jgi:predicted HAD superfamily Cof-like phosphohydrolase